MAFSAVLVRSPIELRAQQNALASSPGRYRLQGRQTSLLTALQQQQTNLQTALAQTNALLTALQDENFEVRRRAVNALGQMKSEQALPCPPDRLTG